LANIASSRKKNRQRIKHEARNRARKSEMRTAVKKLRTALTAKDPAKAREALGAAATLVTRAGQSGVIKPRTASRTVSRLTRAVGALK
jgi:small subunit ribosomal protein S20